METNSVKFFSRNQYEIPQGVNPPILIAWKLRTPENYGNLIRLADTVGCSKVLFVVDDIQLSDRKVRKTAGDSYDRVDFKFVNAVELAEHIPENYKLVAVETAEESKNIYNVVLPSNIALVVGNEKKGIEMDALGDCSHVVHIPLPGKCTSLNVTHATAIALFEWLRQVMAQ